MIIRDALAHDAQAACAVLRDSISQLCVADHHDDPEILSRWLANKTPENVAAWADEGKFGAAASYPMANAIERGSPYKRATQSELCEKSG